MNISDEKILHEWLEGLKPGDEVAVRSVNYSDAPYRLSKVERVTKAQIQVVGYDKKFDRNSGYRIGAVSSFSRGRPRLQIPTPEARDAAELYELVQWLQGLVGDHGRKHPPLHILRALKKAYDEAGAARRNPIPTDQPT